MFSCSECYDNPCLCGEQYKHLQAEELNSLIQKLTEIQNSQKVAEPVSQSKLCGVQNTPKWEFLIEQETCIPSTGYVYYGRVIYGNPEKGDVATCGTKELKVLEMNCFLNNDIKEITLSESVDGNRLYGFENPKMDVGSTIIANLVEAFLPPNPKIVDMNPEYLEHLNQPSIVTMVPEGTNVKSPIVDIWNQPPNLGKVPYILKREKGCQPACCKKSAFWCAWMLVPNYELESVQNLEVKPTDFPAFIICFKHQKVAQIAVGPVEVLESK